MTAIEFFVADYANSEHASAIVDLLDQYAHEPVGGGKPLSRFVRDNLVSTLSETPGAFSVLGYQERAPIALANCFRSLSTFACRPLINIHDLVVIRAARGQGISQQVLSFIETQARESGCCKVTLEVLERHEMARRAYTKFGFEPYELDDCSGHAMFMHKVL